MDRHISAPVGRETAEELRAGDYVYITGTIYTARDAAHKRMYETLREGGDLPINIEGQAIYYMGPSPAREGRPIGSAGLFCSCRRRGRAAVKMYYIIGNCCL